MNFTEEELQLINRWYTSSKHAKQADSMLLANKVDSMLMLESKKRARANLFIEEDITLLAEQLYRINKFNVRHTAGQISELKKQAVANDNFDLAAKYKNLESLLNIYLTLYNDLNLD